MALKLFFANKATGKRYEVVDRFPETNEVRLRNADGAEFNLTFDKAQFKEMGYDLVKEDEDDGE